MKEARTIYHSQPFVIHGGTSRNPSFSSVSSFFQITPNLVSRIQIIMNLNLYNLVSYPQSLRFFYYYLYLQVCSRTYGGLRNKFTIMFRFQVMKLLNITR
jgi:hypothetical protein